MKKYIVELLIAMFFLMAPLFGQELENELKISQFTNSDVIAADNQYIYCSISSNLMFNIPPLHSYLYKLDFELKVVDSLDLNALLGLDSTEYFYLTDIQVGEQGLIYGLGNILRQTTSCDDRSSLILKLNQALMPIDTFYLRNDSIEFIYVDMEVQNSKAIITGTAIQCGKTTYKPCVAKVNLIYGNWQFNFFKSLGNLYTAEFTDPVYFENKIIVNTSLGLNRLNFTATAVLDSNLSIIREGSIADATGIDDRAIRGSGAFLPVSRDSVWKISSTVSQIANQSYWNFGVTLLDSGFNATRIDTFPLSGYNYMTTAQIYNMVEASFDAYDYYSFDSVLYVQGEKYIDYGNYSSKDSTAFYIYNFNARQGTMNWMRRISRNYTIGGHSVAALPGNRWAISFNEYNWDKYPGENLSVHIWILNGNGDIVSNKEFISAVSTIELYPNPAHDHLNLSLKSIPEREKLSYKILNESGHIIQTGFLEGSVLNIKNLNPGNFLILIGKGPGQSIGKFLKF